MTPALEACEHRVSARVLCMCAECGTEFVTVVSGTLDDECQKTPLACPNGCHAGATVKGLRWTTPIGSWTEF